MEFEPLHELNEPGVDQGNLLGPMLSLKGGLDTQQHGNPQISISIYKIKKLINMEILYLNYFLLRCKVSQEEGFLLNP